MGTPTQKGTQLLVKAAPTFTNFIVVDGSWKETDPLQIEEILDGNSETINYTGSNPGVDAECEWVIKTGQTPAAALDEVTATYPDATTMKFIVQGQPQTSFLGGKPVRQSVKLAHRASMTYSA